MDVELCSWEARLQVCNTELLTELQKLLTLQALVQTTWSSGSFFYTYWELFTQQQGDTHVQERCCSQSVDNTSAPGQTGTNSLSTFLFDSI